MVVKHLQLIARLQGTNRVQPVAVHCVKYMLNEYLLQFEIGQDMAQFRDAKVVLEERESEEVQKMKKKLYQYQNAQNAVN